MILKEYEYLQCKNQNEAHFIGKRTFEALEKFVLENEESAQYLRLTTKKGFGKVLQAQNYVGVIQTKDGTTIEILPKIQHLSEEKSKTTLLKMLKTLKNSPFKSLNTAHLKSAKIPLFEIFITMFLDELSRLVKKGIKSDYIPKEKNLTFLKGKLKLSQQIKQNTIHKERFFVDYEEFSSNRPENRLIKTALLYLYKKSRSNKNQQHIREFLFVFDDIMHSRDIRADFLHVRPNRQTKDYKQVLIWCKTFLLENTYSPYRGDDIAFALLFDMNLLFENYVGHYLKKRGLHVKLQDRQHHLCHEGNTGRFQLKPDIVINDGLVVADTKWKRLNQEKSNGGIAQGDMYQLYAYGTKYPQCKRLYLIYPKDETTPSRRFKYNEKGLVLKTYFFDIENTRFVTGR
jgi:5-methylcytosine-specific restriction enzyme subunit McrC